jgi:arylsulfatase A-like enzyme
VALKSRPLLDRGAAFSVPFSMSRLALAAFIATALLAQASAAVAASAARPPNLILIVSDDQGFDLGAYGSTQFVTPHLDRMAAEGVRATNFYVTASVCTPSRSGLITGRYPQRNGTYEMIRNDMVNYGHRYTPVEYAISPEMTLGLDVRELTFGDVLRSAGYRNACFGKWDMGQARRFLPRQRALARRPRHLRHGYFPPRVRGLHPRAPRAAVLPLPALQRPARRLQP